ncbi:unnamed protein product, partial [Coregonus sp. 'balchen']
RDYSSIDSLMDEDEERSAKATWNLLASRHNINIALITVRRQLKKLEWSYGKARFDPKICLTNKELHLLQAGSKLARHSMTSSSQTNQSWPLTNLLKIATEKKEEDQASRVPSIPSNSHQGPGPYLIFDGIMAREFFEEEIIKRCAGPYVREVFLAPHHFFQDNDPKHTVALVCIANKGINWVKTPAESPDLNLIELVWHQLKTFICNSAKPTSKDELVKTIKTFWLEKLKIQQCNKYTDNLSKVLPMVVELGGSATKM